MRSAALLWPSVAMLASCAATPTDTNAPLSRTCARTDCFYERNVRDFDVIDQTTLVLYVGQQRCPFVMELDGIFCDVTYTPLLEFGGRDTRICSYHRGELDLGPIARDEARCRIREVRAITDDELLELLVDRGVLAPPPPVGPGEVRVVLPEEGEEEGEPIPAPETSEPGTAGEPGAAEE